MAERDLTPTQYLTLAHFASGHTLKETAHAMGIKPQTVKNHAETAYLTLRVHNRWEAFFVLGWLKPPDLKQR